MGGDWLRRLWPVGGAIEELDGPAWLFLSRTRGESWGGLLPVCSSHRARQHRVDPSVERRDSPPPARFCFRIRRLVSRTRSPNPASRSRRRRTASRSCAAGRRYAACPSLTVNFCVPFVAIFVIPPPPRQSLTLTSRLPSPLRLCRTRFCKLWVFFLGATGSLRSSLISRVCRCLELSNSRW